MNERTSWVGLLPCRGQEAPQRALTEDCADRDALSIASNVRRIPMAARRLR
jgi:hypothetical protein